MGELKKQKKSAANGNDKGGTEKCNNEPFPHDEVTWEKKIVDIRGTETAPMTVNTVFVFQCHHIPPVDSSLLETHFLCFALYAYYYWPHATEQPFCCYSPQLLTMYFTVNG